MQKDVFVAGNGAARLESCSHQTKEICAGAEKVFQGTLQGLPV
jgi:hypothetical protein